MIIVYDKETKAVIGVATKVFDNSRWREPTLEELYPDVDRTNWGYFYVEDSPKYALRPDAWQINVDENDVPSVGRKPIRPKIYLTTDAQDADGDGLPELLADGMAQATIFAEVKDRGGKPLEQDAMLLFKTTGGTLSARKVRTEGGKASVKLTSSVETIAVTVTASAEGIDGGSLVLEFVPREETR